jgi:hypothetical protein
MPIPAARPLLAKAVCSISFMWRLRGIGFSFLGLAAAPFKAVAPINALTYATFRTHSARVKVWRVVSDESLHVLHTPPQAAFPLGNAGLRIQARRGISSAHY